MHRRSLLLATGTAALSLAMPKVSRSAAGRTLRHVPHVDLAFLDPHWTTANITRNHGFMVFDTLYGQDENYAAAPQMVEGHVVENDGKLWTLRLREGLLWHDGERVLARDCVASIRRWAQRDAFGGALMRATDELSAPDDRTIRFRLKKPFPLLPDALGKSPVYMPAMMPERLAKTDAMQQITEIVGSGPFRYKADERLQGSRNIYERFAGYKPRESGTPSGTAGPKVAYFDRVEWTTITDASTAAAAMQSGEQDWWEHANHDLLPVLRRSRSIKVEVVDPAGILSMMRPNHLQPPFDNPEIRRIVMRAIDQESYMQAIVGDDPSMYHTPIGVFCPGTPMASDAGLEPLRGPRNYDKVKADLKAAGYAGEKVVLLVPSDYAVIKPLGDVAADMFSKIGMNVEYVSTDWGTLLQRRTNKGPVEQGGWNCFVTNWNGTDWMTPATHIAMRGTGEAGYAGWSTSPRTEELYEAWYEAPDDAARARICQDIQRQCMTDVPFYPLGQMRQPSAWRNNITGVLGGFAKFWNVRPA
ncbi:ABC transporter substrate-binding protein [Teichococcus aestuarii]|uniref:ABC transporter substrate-binding protein n=1 Tax=Teichococcus aestuarii TaxID=568898 RepID=A0A2U1UY26_9PROT|nr:ABC transporter substrate-binding protein [Pseudoroseomonas aestuarii]PWC26558.1 ABC transporter substrate-binding protein [Pseudoroseomonas aestuarii]